MTLRPLCSSIKACLKKHREPLLTNERFCLFTRRGFCMMQTTHHTKKKPSHSYFSTQSNPDSINSSGSVLSSEVSKFSSLSSTWWDSSQNPLVSMNPIRIQRILQVMKSRHSDESLSSFSNETLQQDPYPLMGMKALDVGCGGGVLSESLARLGASVTAIDPSIEIVNVAKERAKRDKYTKNNIDYRGGMSVEDLASSPSNHGTYDLVCILEVIEHASDPQSLLQAAAQLLKHPSKDNPGGTLFISTLNRTPKSYLFGIVGAEQIMKMLPEGTHDWNKFKTPKEVEEMVQRVSFGTNPLQLCQLDVCGMIFFPDVFAKSFHWTLSKNDLDVNWIGSYGLKQNVNVDKEI